MSHYARYKKYRPKVYRARIPIFWWVHKWEHTRFILRELTSVFVAFVVIELLLQVRALSAGPEAYAAFMAWLASPLALILNTAAMAMVLYHSISWFKLAPKAMAFRVGRKRVPGWLIAGSNFAAWGLFSVVIAWIFLTT